MIQVSLEIIVFLFHKIVKFQILVVGVNALTEMSSEFISTKNNMNFTMTFDGNKERKIEINENDTLKIHELDLNMKPSYIQTVHLTANGTGIGYAGISCNFVTKKIVEKQSSFFLSVGTNLENESKIIKLKICTYYNPEASKTYYGMAIIEVNLPSGFKFQDQKLIYQKLQKFGVRVSYTYN